MNIVTWNINGMKSAIEKGDFLKLLDEDIDILCLQEVKISDMEYVRKNVPSNYNIYINSAEKKGYSGVAILTKTKANREEYKIGIDRFDAEGRYIYLEHDKFVIYNLYIPHGNRDKRNLKYKLEICNKIIDKIKQDIKEQKKIIITTDFNIAHKEIDLARPSQNRKNIMFTDEERKIIDNILEIGMVDSFREKNKDGNCYTWWPYAFNAKERNLGWRIDYIFVSENIKNKIEKINILKEIEGSDHCPTKITLKFDN